MNNYYILHIHQYGITVYGPAATPGEVASIVGQEADIASNDDIISLEVNAITGEMSASGENPAEFMEEA